MYDIVLCFTYRCVKLWSLVTYKPLAKLPHADSLTSLLLSNLLLVSACQSGSVQLWSLEPYHPTKQHSLTPTTTTTTTTCSMESDSPVTQWQLDDGVYLTDMLLEGDKIYACGRYNQLLTWSMRITLC